jgi:hypothetical protein
LTSRVAVVQSLPSVGLPTPTSTTDERVRTMDSVTEHVVSGRFSEAWQEAFSREVFKGGCPVSDALWTHCQSAIAALPSMPTTVGEAWAEFKAIEDHAARVYGECQFICDALVTRMDKLEGLLYTLPAKTRDDYFCRLQFLARSTWRLGTVTPFFSLRVP